MGGRRRRAGRRALRISGVGSDTQGDETGAEHYDNRSIHQCSRMFRRPGRNGTKSLVIQAEIMGDFVSRFVSGEAREHLSLCSRYVWQR